MSDFLDVLKLKKKAPKTQGDVQRTDAVGQAANGVKIRLAQAGVNGALTQQLRQLVDRALHLCDAAKYDDADTLLADADRVATRMLADKQIYDQERLRLGGELNQMANRNDPGFAVQQQAFNAAHLTATGTDNYAQGSQLLVPVAQWSAPQLLAWGLVDAYDNQMPALSVKLNAARAAPGNNVQGHSLAGAWATLLPAWNALPPLATAANAAQLQGWHDDANGAVDALLLLKQQNDGAIGTYNQRHPDLKSDAEMVLDVTSRATAGGPALAKLRTAIADNLDGAEQWAALGDGLHAVPFLDALEQAIADIQPVVQDIDRFNTAKTTTDDLSDYRLGQKGTGELLDLFESTGLFSGKGGDVRSVNEDEQQRVGKRLAAAMKLPENFAKATRAVAKDTIERVMIDPELVKKIGVLQREKKRFERIVDEEIPEVKNAREAVAMTETTMAEQDARIAQNNQGYARALQAVEDATAAIANAELQGRGAQRKAKNDLAVATRILDELRVSAGQSDPQLKLARQQLEAAKQRFATAKANVPLLPRDERASAAGLAAAQEIASQYCKGFAIDPVPVELRPTDNTGDCGTFDQKDVKIYLNPNANSFAVPKELIDVVMHETTHYYQFYVVMMFAKGEIGPDNPNYQAARVLAANFLCYTPPEEDHATYEKQPTEAQAYDIGVAMGRAAVMLKNNN